MDCISDKARTHPKVSFSKLMMGTVQLGLPYGIANRQGQPDYRDVLEILECAYQGGVNCLDTAATYGSSEEVLGRALAELNLADKMLVVTKIRPVPPELSSQEAARHIRASIENSLRRLRLAALPVCLFHWEDDFRYAGVLQSLQEKGVVREIGASTMTPAATESILASGLAQAIQIPANLLDHRFRLSQVFPLAQEHRASVFVRSIYLQGLLLMPAGDIPPHLAAATPVLQRIHTLARDAGLDVTEMAMRYALSLPRVTSVVVGMESVEQVRRNVALFEKGGLEKSLVQAIEASIPRLPDEVLLPTLWPKPE